MSGITNLDQLIREMNPSLDSKDYVFCTVPSIPKINFLMTFKEKEGITLVLEKEIADKNNLNYSSIWSLITLNVHSSLSAVGFLARITNKLAEANISVNAVSAFYHDHIFVQKDKSNKALLLLKELSTKN